MNRSKYGVNTPETTLPKIGFAEDHTQAYKGIEGLLKANAHLYKFVGGAKNGDDAVQLVLLKDPDLMILDYQMPGLDGVALVRMLRSINSNLKILMHTAYDDEVYYKTLTDCGVQGFLTKSATDQEILKAIQSILNGVRVFPNNLKMDLEFDIARANSKLNTLTTRELEVLWTIVSKHEREDALKRLGISINTFNNYISQTGGKLDQTQEQMRYYAAKWLVLLELHTVPIKNIVARELKVKKNSSSDFIPKS